MFHIMVVEDDEVLNKMICTKLKQENFVSFQAYDGEEALDILDKEHIDLIITDIMMPHMNGFELTKELRKAQFHTPILMITAKSQMEDMEIAFHAGTDDYMVKPIRMQELILRVNALLRRAQIASERKLQFHQTILDYDALSVETYGDKIELPPKEFYVLYKLLMNQGKIFTRLELMDEIWGMDSTADERTVDSHIKKLRRKFEENPDFEIITIRGLGYKCRIKDKAAKE